MRPFPSHSSHRTWVVALARAEPAGSLLSWQTDPPPLPALSRRAKTKQVSKQLVKPSGNGDGREKPDALGLSGVRHSPCSAV